MPNHTPIDASMELEDVARISPVAIRLLTKRGSVCIACGTPLWKTVEEAITDAGIEDIAGTVTEINAELAQQD